MKPHRFCFSCISLICCQWIFGGFWERLAEAVHLLKYLWHDCDDDSSKKECSKMATIYLIGAPVCSWVLNNSKDDFSKDWEYFISVANDITAWRRVSCSLSADLAWNAHSKKENYMCGQRKWVVNAFEISKSQHKSKLLCALYAAIFCWKSKSMKRTLMVSFLCLRTQ